MDHSERKMRPDGFGFETTPDLQIVANCYVDDQGSVFWHVCAYPLSGFGRGKDYWIDGDQFAGIDGVHLFVPGYGGTVFMMAEAAPELAPEERTCILEAVARLQERRLRWIDNGRPPL